MTLLSILVAFIASFLINAPLTAVVEEQETEIIAVSMPAVKTVFKPEVKTVMEQPATAYAQIDGISYIEQMGVNTPISGGGFGGYIQTDENGIATQAGLEQIEANWAATWKVNPGTL